MKVRFTQLGITPNLASPNEFDEVLKADWRHSANLIADLKIVPD